MRIPASGLASGPPPSTGAEDLCARAASRQIAPEGVTINNLLPGIHATERAVALDTGVMKAQGVSMEQAQAQRRATIPVRRYGTIDEFGATCAFLCSQHAGFIVGQNILLDGGSVSATF